jgi:hypothetical protein
LTSNDKDTKCKIPSDINLLLCFQVINHQPYDNKADVFSFAIVLWELITSKVFILLSHDYLYLPMANVHILAIPSLDKGGEVVLGLTSQQLF